MSKVALKKYVEEQLEFDLESYLDDVIHDFAFRILKIKIFLILR